MDNSFSFHSLESKIGMFTQFLKTISKIQLSKSMEKKLFNGFLLGVLLLPALLFSGCNEPSQPKCGVEIPEQKDETVHLVIEGVTVNGKPATDEELRAIGRKDVVHFNNKIDGEDLIQIEHNDVTRGKTMLLRFFAKPNIYLKNYGYRYTQKQQYTRVVMNADSYQSGNPLELLKNPKGRERQPVPTQDAVENVVYVTVDYESAREADYIMTMSTSISGEEAYDFFDNNLTRTPNFGWESVCTGGVHEPDYKKLGNPIEYYDVKHEFSIFSPSGKPLDVKIPVTLSLQNTLIQIYSTETTDPDTSDVIERTEEIEKIKELKGVQKEMVLAFNRDGRCSIDARSLLKAFDLKIGSSYAFPGYSYGYYGPYVENPTPFIKSFTIPSRIHESPKTTVTYKSSEKEKTIKLFLR